MPLPPVILPIFTAIYSGSRAIRLILSEGDGGSGLPLSSRPRFTVCNGQIYSRVNRPGDPPPAPGPLAAGPCIRTGRIYLTLAGTDGTMPREPHILISTRMATSVAEERRTERLSLRAAIF
jgi:hypothetical protein